MRWLLFSLCVAAAGCQTTVADPEKVAVVATTSIIADAVREVGGDRVAVQVLMGPGIDPHKYIPTAGDLSKLAGAKIVFFNGLHLEGKMTDVLEKSGQAVPVARGLAESELHKFDDAHDPHIWFDPLLWSRCVDVIAEELARLDPAHAGEYHERAESYAGRIRTEHAALEALAASLPKARRILVTSHDAFGYFGARYGFEVHGLQGVSTATETGLQDRQKLAAFLGKQRIPAVFGETSVPPKGLAAVLDSVKAEYGLAVKLVGGDDALYSDALGPAGSPGATYLGMLRHNMGVIVGALK